MKVVHKKLILFDGLAKSNYLFSDLDFLIRKQSFIIIEASFAYLSFLPYFFDDLAGVDFGDFLVSGLVWPREGVENWARYLLPDLIQAFSL